MEVKPGYKQTEVGVIPEDWEVRDLQDCCAKITDGTHDTPKPVKSGVPFLTAIHVKENRIDYDGCLYVTKADHEVIFKRCNPQRGDVLMVNIGAGVATTALVEVDYEFSLKNVALLKPAATRMLGAYLNYCLAMQKRVITQALLRGGAQPFLSLMQIGQIKIPVPSKEEQCAIARTLGDVDTLLDALENLIAKKRDLKQAAMQQLLTGRKRLPGFTEKWEMRKLGDIASLYQPETISQNSFVSDGYPVYGANGIIGRYHRYNHDTWQTTISCRGNCGTVNKTEEKSWITGNAMVVNCDANTLIDKLFLYYLLSSLDFSILVTGSGQPQIVRDPLADFKIRLPVDRGEQTAIAGVLSDMDAEIAALEQRLAKTRALKQGMMQELLTGRTRLI